MMLLLLMVMRGLIAKITVSRMKVLVCSFKLEARGTVI